MGSLHDMTIKHKLSMTTIATCVIGLLLASVAFMVLNFNMKHHADQRLGISDAGDSEEERGEWQ